MIKTEFVTFSREPFFEIARELIQPGDKVLDIGAGEGDFADYCQKKDIYLYDGNPESVALLKEKHKNTFYGKLPLLPFEKDFFDLIHLSHVIEHLQPEDAYKTLEEMGRCCKPGGKIVISTPLFWDGFYDDLSHIKPYNPLVIEKYLGGAKKKNLTRTEITDQFKLLRLEYRYRENFPEWDLYKSSQLIKYLLKLITFLRRKFYKKYSRTGYTIVLEKQNT
ncbi:class I SAM-dependent methyltransferase [Salegentibacter sp. F188]|uniref:Class I SAM-dependent methyltransferase n=1 Tax=Autumnicola patrickiae TaxID=3075591 RepID=A0ABU3DX88_9FLAO|nr:class I SAM-dependent methyltransferase [Salegentibacter sp. F188]MDT0688341.1 class I SAM-dependent methyltransferase [Salegentibacter sp. F188]